MKKLVLFLAFPAFLAPAIASAEADLPELTDAPLPDLDSEGDVEAVELAPVAELEPTPDPGLDTEPEAEAQPPPSPEPAPPPAPPPAAAPTLAPAAEPEPPTPSSTPWQISLGLHLTYISSKGFDVFAEDDALPQVSLGAGRTVFHQDNFSLAVLGSLDLGGRNGTARGESTELTVISLSLGPEARYHLSPWAFVHVRPSASAARTLATINEGSANAALHSDDWLVGFDVAAGAAVSLGRLAKASDVRAWIVAEGGYAWSSQTDLAFRPEDGDADSPLGISPLHLGELALRGPMFRVAAAFTF